jgi:N-carbamoylputrescine amidase
MRASPFTIGIIQDHATDDEQANVARAVELIRQAAAQGAQIICLKELFNTPYFAKSTRVEHFDLAQPVPGPLTDTFQALAKELAVVIVVPIFVRRAAGLYMNSAVVIDADGAILGVYDKMHIPHDPMFEEKYYFTPGDAHLDYHGERPGEANGFKVWKTRYATIGVLVCWDQWYPEAARITALLGADVLFYPTAIAWHPAEKDEWGDAQVQAWRTAQRAHAIANGVWVASPNRVGHEDEPRTNGLEFFGHSFIADPFGRVVAEASTEQAVLVHTCDPKLQEEVRRNWPFLRDRRVDAYRPILNRYIGQPGRETRDTGAGSR